MKKFVLSAKSFYKTIASRINVAAGSVTIDLQHASAAIGLAVCFAFVVVKMRIVGKRTARIAVMTKISMSRDAKMKIVSHFYLDCRSI